MPVNPLEIHAEAFWLRFLTETKEENIRRTIPAAAFQIKNYGNLFPVRMALRGEACRGVDLYRARPTGHWEL